MCSIRQLTACGSGGVRQLHVCTIQEITVFLHKQHAKRDGESALITCEV